MRTQVERELSTHFAALRALARDLVGEHDADDLVQDTALRALSNGPARPGPLGGWLRLVLQRLAGRRRRAEHRRWQRERSVARPEAVPQPQDAVEHRETFRTVTGAVLALAEPYQRTLLLRYLEDLTPQAIAARTGESVATVKSRLQRGLALLRERLDQGRGRQSWRPAMVSAFGLRSGTAALVTGAVVMGTGTKLLFGGAAALLALAAWFFTGSEPQQNPPVPAANQATETLPTGAALPSPDAGAQDPSRHEVPAVATQLAAKELATIRGCCVGEDGMPVAGVRAAVTGRMDPGRAATFQGQVDWSDPAPQTTGEDGRFEFHFAPPLPMRFSISVGSASRIGGSTNWAGLQPGQVVDLGDVPTLGACALSLRVVDTEGTPVARTGISMEWRRPAGFRSPLDVSGIAGGRTDDAGRLQIKALLPGVHSVRVSEREMVKGGEASLTPDDDAVREVVVAALGPGDVISGIVVDESGMPVARATIYGSVNNRSLGADTGKDGSFRLLRQPRDGDGLARFSIAQGGFEPLVMDAGVAWGTNDLRLVLRRGTSVEVLAVTSDGAPVDDYRIWLLPRQGAFRGMGGHECEARSDGRHPGGLATIAGLERGPYFAVVQADDPSLCISRPQQVDVGDATPRVVVHLARAAKRPLRVQTRDGAPVVHARVRLLEPAGTAACSAERAVPMAQWVFTTINGERNSPPFAILLLETMTDSRGEVLLRGQPGVALTVAVADAEHTPLQADGVRLDDPEPLVVTVQEGARLRIQTPPEVLRALGVAADLTPGARWASKVRPSLQLQRGSLGPGQKLEHFPEKEAVPFDESGKVSMDQVPQGAWRVLLRVPSFPGAYTEQVATVDLRAGDTTELQLDLGAWLPAELTGRVFWNGQPLQSDASTRWPLQLWVETRDVNGQTLKLPGFLKTDAEGGFRWMGRAGVLRVEKGDSLFAVESVTLQPGDKATQDFHGTSGHVKFRVLDADAQPMPKLYLILQGNGGRTPVWTDAQGVALREIPVADYRVEALPPRYLRDPDAEAAVKRAAVDPRDPMAAVRVHLGDVVVTAGGTAEATFHMPREQPR